MEGIYLIYKKVQYLPIDLLNLPLREFETFRYKICFCNKIIINQIN